MSFGGFSHSSRQRAAKSMSAVESGPPETARINTGKLSSALKSLFASAAAIGAASLATDSFLLTVDALLYRDCCARVFAPDLGERGAGGLLLAQRSERLAEAQERVGRLGGRFVFGRDAEEGFGSVAETLALEQALAQPILRVGSKPVARKSAQEGAKALVGERIILAQHVAIGEVVIVLGTVGGRRRRKLRTGAAWIARRWRRELARDRSRRIGRGRAAQHR